MKSHEEIDMSSTNIPIAQKMLNYELMPRDHLQSKIDFYITPYNKKISMKKHMDFGRSILTAEELFKVMNGGEIDEESW